MGKKGWIIFSSIFAAAVIGLQVYEIVVKGIVDTHSITRTVILLLCAGLTFFRKNSGFSDTRAIKKAYKRAYGELIGSAFEGRPKQEKYFYAALHNYNNNKFNAALDKLEDLDAECESIDERFAVTFFRALCLDDMNRPADAVKLYEKAATLKRDSTAISNAGICYSHMGDFESAERCYLDAADIDNNAITYNNLAQLYMEKDEYEKALDYAMTALGIDAKCREALDAAAVCNAMLGNEDEYNEYLRRAVICGSDADAVKHYIDLLKFKDKD